MKRWSFLAVAVAVLGLGVWANTPHGAAQVGTEKYPVCKGTAYDINKDGVLTKADLSGWFDVVKAAGCMDAQVDENQACAPYDYDRSLQVNDLDLAVAHSFYMACITNAQVIPDAGR